MKFTMTVKLDNAAFLDDPDELSRILRKVAEDVKTGFARAAILDSNGNTVGRWERS